MYQQDKKQPLCSNQSSNVSENSLSPVSKSLLNQFFFMPITKVHSEFVCISK